jgi:IS5 family transposase
LAAVFGLKLRQTEGFLVSLFRIMKIEQPIPDSSTLCRRRKTLKVLLRVAKRSKDEPIHVVVDSTGLKIYGEGEWKVRQHGYSKRRTWRKLHLAVDEKTGEILSEELTENGVHDGDMALPLVNQIEDQIGQFSGDGAYDSHVIHDELEQRGITTTIPPRRGSRTRRHGNHKEKKGRRDQIVRRIRKVGRKRWKEESGYHRRSLSETAMFRIKTIFGDHLSARKLENQRVEASIRCRALNRMTNQGMPDSYKVAA